MNRCFVLILLAACCWNLSAGAKQNQTSSKQPNNFCQGCRSLMAFGSTLNSTQNRDDYKEILKSYCELYYPTSTDYQQGPCPLFVDAFYYSLDRIDPVLHCDNIGACGRLQVTGQQHSLAPELASLTAKQAGEVCKFCEQTVEQVRAALSEPGAVEQVRRHVYYFCNYLQVVEADKECRQLADKYLDQAVEFIRNIDPLAYCRSVQLCSAKNASRPVAARKSGASRSLSAQRRLPTLADFNNFGIETSVTVGAKQQQSKGGNPNCVICKMFVKEMFQFLRENKTEANIIKGLNEVCQVIFPQGQTRADCQSMARAYTKELVQLLIDETDPEMICIILELCAGGEHQKTAVQATSVAPEEKSFNLANLISSLDPSAKLKSARICFECKIFIKYLRDAFDEPKSRDEIKSWLVDNLCVSIPDKQVGEQCKRLIEQYGDIFFAAVIGNLNPNSACAELGACTRKNLQEVLYIDNLASIDKPDELPSLLVSPKSSAEPRRHMQKKMPTREQKAVRGQLCDQCVLIVTQIDEYLANHPIDKDISVLIDQVCNKMPEGSVRNECVYLIEAFGTQIALAVASMDNPRQLCSSIMLCKT